MSSFHQKISRNTKKQERIGHSKEKNESTETVPKKDQMVDLLGKDIKTTVFSCCSPHGMQTSLIRD